MGSGTGMSGGGTGLMSGGGESIGSIGRGKSGFGGCSMLILDAMCNNPARVGPAAGASAVALRPQRDQRIHSRLTCFTLSKRSPSGLLIRAGARTVFRLGAVRTFRSAVVRQA